MCAQPAVPMYELDNLSPAHLAEIHSLSPLQSSISFVESKCTCRHFKVCLHGTLDILHTSVTQNL